MALLQVPSNDEICYPSCVEGSGSPCGLAQQEMFNKRSRGSNTEPVHRLSRPRSSIATRAIIGVGCLGSIVCILLFQFFVLPSSRVTTLDAAQIAPTNTAPTLDARARTAVCHGDCGDQVSSGKPVDNGVSASAKASVLASKQTTFKGPVPNVKPSRHPDSSEWPNTVALCAMMKTEHSEDVLEWLDYHRCAHVVCANLLRYHKDGSFASTTPRRPVAIKVWVNSALSVQVAGRGQGVPEGEWR